MLLTVVEVNGREGLNDFSLCLDRVYVKGEGRGETLRDSSIVEHHVDNTPLVEWLSSGGIAVDGPLP